MTDSNPKIYIKDESFDPIYKSVNPEFLFKSRILSGLLMALGFVVLGTQVVIPLISFKTQDKIAKPVESSVLGLATGFGKFEFTELNYENKQNKQTQGNVPDKFYLSIPKLGIENAQIETNSTDLSPEDTLGHYNGSALPGENGNTFIYGHSVLPWFFNPKNYKTIFSTLGNLGPGDVFIINFNNKDYEYRVDEKIVLTPAEVNPLGEWKPSYLNDSTAVLMTCWPAGTKNKRLEIRATLVD